MSSLERLRRFRRAVRRRILARRRWLAALCAGIAVAAGIQAAAPSSPTAVAVWVAIRDLPAGTVLSADDVRRQPLAPDSVPDGTAPDPVGEVLAAPVRGGEPLTDVRLVGAGLASVHPDLTTIPVRLPDPGIVELLEPGDRIDLLATDPQAGGSRVVAADAVVLATPPPREATAATTPPGALVVLGVAPASVAGVTEASVRWFLSYSFSR